MLTLHSQINGLAGITLGAILQSFATIIGGSIIGLIYNYKVALVSIGMERTLCCYDGLWLIITSIACMPFLVSAGYIRLVSYRLRFILAK